MSDAPPTSASKPVRRLRTAALHPTADIHMSYLYPWDGVVETPFGAGWAVVGPGETTRRHMHHEGETWFVMEGTGLLETDGETREVGPGDTIYLPPFVRHSLTNPHAEARLVFLTVWWQDMALAARTPEADAPEAPTTPVVVNVAPPTPNGDLHLGHLAGPYLAADLLVRALRMSGVEASYVMGTDDHQSYVQGKALQTGESAAHVANHFAERIAGTLAAAGIRPDVFLRPMHAPGYATSIQDVVERLHRDGHLVARETPALADPEDGRHLFEFYVGGHCPHCTAPAGGGGCEECGRPNDGHDLLKPRTTLGDREPVRTTVRRLVLPLAPHEARIRTFLKTARMSPHLRSLCERMLAEGLPEVPLTQPHAWGVPCSIEGFEDQIISAWIELAFHYLAALREQARVSEGALPQAGLVPSRALRHVQCFGFDNGFVYALVYPLLYELLDDTFVPPSTFVVNEFYLLEGKKFSTSRDHAVWVREICEQEPRDLVRWYVTHTRPQAERSDFTRAGYRRHVDEVLRGTWAPWLQELGSRLHRARGGTTPEPGYWTDEHRAFLRRLETFLQEVQTAYRPETFAPRRITRACVALVEEARAFGQAEKHWVGVPDRDAEVRTALALELAAARALALATAPIMPAFAAQLWHALGEVGTPEDVGFGTGVGWAPPGATVDLTGPWFAA